MKKHFVIFLSPGSFFPEASEKPISSWDVATAVKMAKSIKERYNATPYGFYFVTRERGPKDLGSKEYKTSGIYYLGGIIHTLADIEARKDPADEILIFNMKCNHWDKVIVNTNSWEITQPFTAKDHLLEWDGMVDIRVAKDKTKARVLKEKKHGT